MYTHIVLIPHRTSPCMYVCVCVGFITCLPKINIPRWVLPFIYLREKLRKIRRKIELNYYRILVYFIYLIICMYMYNVICCGQFK